jgi:cellulose synthase/poly-beta-1,6-N-acetylglucosamine synthase-like glycosyltransferase
VAFIQLYLLCAYLIGYCGRYFDPEKHRQIVAENSYTSNHPLVDIYLLCCKERLEVLENTYKYVSKLDYPNFKVWVLDDGGLNTVKRLATHYGFNFIARDNKRFLKKAGLQYPFPRTTGEFSAPISVLVRISYPRYFPT